MYTYVHVYALALMMTEQSNYIRSSNFSKSKYSYTNSHAVMLMVLAQ